MKTRLIIFLVSIISMIGFSACEKFPVDDDGLLITDRDECYLSNFDLLATDRVSVRVGNAEIDNDNCTINITVKYGTDIKHLYPEFSLVTDALLTPKVSGLEDFSEPRRYTVVSGSRRVKKEYTVYVTLQQRN